MQKEVESSKKSLKDREEEFEARMKKMKKEHQDNVENISKEHNGNVKVNQKIFLRGLNNYL